MKRRFWFYRLFNLPWFLSISIQNARSAFKLNNFSQYWTILVNWVCLIQSSLTDLLFNSNLCYVWHNSIDKTLLKIFKICLMSWTKIEAGNCENYSSLDFHSVPSRHHPLISFKLSLDVNALNFQLPQLAHFRSVLMSRLSYTSALMDQWDFNQQNCGTEIENCIARDLIFARVSCKIFRAVLSIKFYVQLAREIRKLHKNANLRWKIAVHENFVALFEFMVECKFMHLMQKQTKLLSHEIMWWDFWRLSMMRSTNKNLWINFPKALNTYFNFKLFVFSNFQTFVLFFDLFQANLFVYFDFSLISIFVYNFLPTRMLELKNQNYFECSITRHFISFNERKLCKQTRRLSIHELVLSFHTFAIDATSTRDSLELKTETFNVDSFEDFKRFEAKIIAICKEIPSSATRDWDQLSKWQQKPFKLCYRAERDLFGTFCNSDWR